MVLCVSSGAKAEALFEAPPRAKLFFLESAFGSGKLLTPIIIRWERPVRIDLHGKYRRSDRFLVNDSFGQFSSAANLRYTFIPSAPNLILIFFDAGEPRKLALLRAFQAAQPHIKVIQGYGLTETSPMITLVEPDKAEAKMGSIGRAVPGVEVKIIDENDKDVAVGEAGEIITRGPHVMKGYFRRPDATAERIRHGWLYTGDVGKVEADGYYYHLGRRDDMIITGGLNVYPAEVENLIYTYPGVQETIVFAIPDAKRGQVIGAAVVPRPGGSVVEKDLLAYLRGNLANFKVPDRIVVRESLPRTSSGKTIREAATLLGS